MTLGALRLCALATLVGCASQQQPAPGTALERYGPKASDKLVTVSSTYDHTQRRTESRELGTSTVTTTYQDTDLFVLSLAGSTFTTPTDELGGRLEYQFANQFTSEEVSFFYNRNLMLNNTSGIYLGISAGAVTRTDGRDLSIQNGDLTWGLQAGYRNWLTRNTVLFVQPRLTFTDSERDRSATDQTRFQVQIGFGVTF